MPNADAPNAEPVWAVLPKGFEDGVCVALGLALWPKGLCGTTGALPALPKEAPVVFPCDTLVDPKPVLAEAVVVALGEGAFVGAGAGDVLVVFAELAVLPNALKPPVACAPNGFEAGADPNADVVDAGLPKVDCPNPDEGVDVAPNAVEAGAGVAPNADVVEGVAPNAEVEGGVGVGPKAEEAAGVVPNAEGVVDVPKADGRDA